jgi:hypothetical protein
MGIAGRVWKEEITRRDRMYRETKEGSKGERQHGVVGPEKNQ